MENLNSLTLAQIVNSNHKTASVFEKYHLDFCCRGKRSLVQACRDEQLPVEDVLKELEIVFAENKPTGTDGLPEKSLGSLCDYIVNIHHNYVKNEIPLIHGYLEKVTSKHGDHHPELIKIFEAFAAVSEEMDRHMKKEENILFPRIREMEKQLQAGALSPQISLTYLQGPIIVMEQEHDHAGFLLNEIRTLSNNYTPPQDACTTYRLSFAALKAFELDLHQHVHLENNLLFPRAIEAFQKLQAPAMN